MNKKLQDIHINNHKTHETKIIREVTINNIIFNVDFVIIEYQTSGIKVTLEVPKPYHAIIIDLKGGQI